MKKSFIFCGMIISIILLTIGIFFGAKKIQQQTNTTSQNENTAVQEPVQQEPPAVENSEEPTLDKVTMTIKEGSLTKKGATIMIEDKNVNPFGYGYWYRIDKKENGEWKELEEKNKNRTVNALAYLVGEDGKAEEKIDWSKDYGTLKKGQYRLVKSVEQSIATDDGKYELETLYFWTEFEIE